MGVVVSQANRRVSLRFPASGEERVYAVDNAPLNRVEYPVGEKVATEEGHWLVIEEVMEANGCLIYAGRDEHGETRVVPEQDLNSHVHFSKPQDRLFAGQIDHPPAFELRYETLNHINEQQRSAVMGLLGPRVQLLPHQLYIAHEVANRYAPRVLLADEVGLGKTIEAGLILHQLLISGRVKRVLIVVPESLLHQWLVEMLRRFNLSFSIIDEARCADAKKSSTVENADTVSPGESRDVSETAVETDDTVGTSPADEPEDRPNPFESSQLVLCTLPFLAGSQERQQQAEAAGWDLLIVDEAHHLHWSEGDASPEYRCIANLASATPSLLLLTATPEQLGVESHFARLRLLDPNRYFDLQTFLAEEQQHQHINELVRQLQSENVAADLAENELPDAIAEHLGQATADQLSRLARDAVADDLDDAIHSAIRALLDRHGTGRVLFRNTRQSVGGFPERNVLAYPLPLPAEWPSGQSPDAGTTGVTPEAGLDDEWINQDPRVSWLVDWVHHRIAADPTEKVLLICARSETAQALDAHLRLRAGVGSAVFHEGLTLVARDRAAAYFADPDEGASILVCSEIGSEGRNFQFAHHLVLFDLPLSPDLLEQRIGRLDRIGQREAVQIHVPYLERSAQEVLYHWYHRGLNAFEQTCTVGDALMREWEEPLLELLDQPDQPGALDELVESVQQRAQKLTLQLQKGRDRLLELNSFDRIAADDIVLEMVNQERRKVLASYAERLFDYFGVEQEHHTSHSLVVKPGEHMLVHHFPGLAQEGMTATFQRELALAREDIDYLTWEHPMVSGAMDMVLSGEFGNTSFCTIRIPQLKQGSILLESIYTLSCIAPPEWQVYRYLPVTDIRILVDARANDLSDILSHGQLNRLCRKVPLHNAQELVRHTRKTLTRIIKSAEELAAPRSQKIIQDAIEVMQSEQRDELERVQALSRVNPNIRVEEIEHLRQQGDELAQIIGNAQLRLDAIRVAMVVE